MKRLLIFIYTLLLTFSLWANKVNIKFIDAENKFSENNRSISMPLSASHDGGTIYLYSDIRVEQLQITIKDGEGNSLFSEIISISSQQPYIFSIGNIENGTYILELNVGESRYQGYFEIYP